MAGQNWTEALACELVQLKNRVVGHGLTIGRFHGAFLPIHRGLLKGSAGGLSYALNMHKKTRRSGLWMGDRSALRTALDEFVAHDGECNFAIFAQCLGLMQSHVLLGIFDGIGIDRNPLAVGLEEHGPVALPWGALGARESHSHGHG